ncbi:CDK-activating kinase assembly factor [Polyplosphaeria fusca]|uniref:RNA polymerase II transcription factor B subunit 3 n=1 Tax=Polyplosphaeria fusca TaxID=682080 RepID=A0A9P4UX18_9PLEO|nr:CDK-activating kinase assembly factor [Polyplosphaeria fusca]
MSKAASRVANGGAKGHAQDGGASPLSSNLRRLSLANPPPKPSAFADPSSDICPVCKSSRYLNPNMVFLVNPECYHKMCESCVERIFSHGPAPCPIAGCKRTLRRPKFRRQTFEDLKVEREVDIRRRVAKAFNKVEQDFETLRDFNDYLEVVEETTWNLILKIDVETTERRLRQFEEAQKAELNAVNPAAARRVNEPDPTVLSSTSHVVLKKGATQRKVASAVNTPDPFIEDTKTDNGFIFRGLKKPKPPPPKKVFDPFEGYGITPDYYVTQESYDVDWLTWFKDDKAHSAGGFGMKDFYDHMLCESFAGLGVFVGEEIEARENGASGDSAIGTQTAAMAAAGGAKDVDMDDVF